MGPVLRLEKECVPPMENRFLEGSFAQRIVQGRSGLPEEEREWGPMRQQVPNRLAQAGRKRRIVAALLHYTEARWRSRPHRSPERDCENIPLVHLIEVRGPAHQLATP